MRPKKPLVFIHVEKVGGITIGVMLHQFLRGFISPFPGLGSTFSKKNFDFVNKYYPIEITGIGGHRLDSKEQYFEDQFVFSMVREPISRLISHYNWQNSRMGIERSFKEFYTNPYFQNFQTFRLTGFRDEASAKQVIDNNYDFIGLLEEYNDTIQILSHELFGDAKSLSYHRENTTSSSNELLKQSELDQEALENLIKINEVDLRIYNYVKEKFYSSYKEMLTNPKNDNLVISKASYYKRKISNSYLKFVLQPRIQKRVEYGY